MKILRRIGKAIGFIRDLSLEGDEVDHNGHPNVCPACRGDFNVVEEQEVSVTLECINCRKQYHSGFDFYEL